MKQSLSRLELVIIHMDPVAAASWEYFLVYNISEGWDSPEWGRPESMFYSSSLSLGVACFGFCLMFLLRSSVCACMGLVPILPRLFAFPSVTPLPLPLTLLSFFLCRDLCCCMWCPCACVCVRLCLCVHRHESVCACVCVGVLSLGR